MTINPIIHRRGVINMKLNQTDLYAHVYACNDGAPCRTPIQPDHMACVGLTSAGVTIEWGDTFITLKEDGTYTVG
jgi:hypothetical protein